MTKPYSMDLRERVVAAVEREGMSRHEAAARFGVAASSAIKWVQRYRETGSVAPARMGGHKPRVLRGEHRDWLLERVRCDFTLRGLVAELAERGVRVDYRQVWEFVHAGPLSSRARWRHAGGTARHRRSRRRGAAPGRAPAVTRADRRDGGHDRKEDSCTRGRIAKAGRNG